MMLPLFAEPTQVWLEISPTSQRRSWQQSQSFSTPDSAWRAYLHQLSLDAILPWLQEEYTPDATVGPHADTLPSIWELVEGVAIALGNQRFVLLPTETLDDDELRVPQEWLDLPDWVADYYLAVQVNPDDGWVRVWGCTTHEQLKTQGTYDWDDRTYSLSGEDLIQDLSVLWVAHKLCPTEPTRVPVDPLPHLSGTQAKNLIERLGNPEIAIPRLEIPFTQWGALLVADEAREQLCHRRRGQSNLVPANLSRWIQNVFEARWQPLEALFPENFAFNFRRGCRLEEEVKRVKSIDIGQNAIVLLVGATPEADEKVGIRVQLHPSRGNSCLPPSIELAVRSDSGEILTSVRARSRDNYIQLPRFKCLQGTSFCLQVTLEGVSVSEEFVV